MHVVLRVDIYSANRWTDREVLSSGISCLKAMN